MNIYHHIKNSVRLLALCFVGGVLFLLSGCHDRLHDDFTECPEAGDNNAGTYLRFNIANTPFKAPVASPTNSTRATSNGNISEIGTGEYDKRYGTPAEQKINKLWVLLFKKGATPKESPLQYVMRFYPEDSSKAKDDGTFVRSITHIQHSRGNSYPNTTFNETDAINNGIITRYTESQQLYSVSTVKKVEPGNYIIVVMANTEQYMMIYEYTVHLYAQLYDAVEHSRSSTTDNFYNYAIFAGRHHPKVTPSGGDIRKYLNTSFCFTFATGIIYSDYYSGRLSSWGFNEGPYNDKMPNERGLYAVYIDEDFNVPTGFTSSQRPFDVKLNLTRMQAKLRVTIDNLNEDGTENLNSRNYKLTKLGINSTEGYKLFGAPLYWNKIERGAVGMETVHKRLHNMLPHQLSFQKREGGSEMRLVEPLKKQDFPLLYELKENGFTRKIEETELFNHYLPPTPEFSDNTSLRYEKYMPKPIDPNDIETLPYLHMEFTHKGTNDVLVYKIPIYYKDPRTGEVDYRVRSNTLYELRLRFHGSDKISVNGDYEVAPWTDVQVDLPW